MLVNTKYRLQVKHFTDIIGKPKRSTGNLKPKVQASTPQAARSQREEARRQAAMGPAFRSAHREARFGADSARDAYGLT